MAEPVYFYTARVNARTHSVLYKTHTPDLEPGTIIQHRYASGASSTVTIGQYLGTELPAHLLSRALSESKWPFIISAF